MLHVWTVEDNANFRKAVVQEINDAEGLCCERALPSCEELLDTLEKAPRSPDVILLDIELPGLSGLDAIAAVKSTHPDVQILVLTLSDDRDTVFRAICAGASGYLLKATDEDIPEAIRQTHSGGAPLSPQIARLVIDSFTRKPQPAVDYRLTSRELEILELMVHGRSKKQIADAVDLSFHTVDSHLRSIYRKLHVNNATSAVSKALRERLCA